MEGFIFKCDMFVCIIIKNNVITLTVKLRMGLCVSGNGSTSVRLHSGTHC